MTDSTPQLRQRKRDRGVKKNAHFRAPRQERETARRLGGNTVKGSGCGSEKGDVRVKGVMRVENKCTSKKSFSITREMITKIENAALGSGEIPAFGVEFLDSKGNPLHEVAVVPMYVLEMLCGGVD